MKDQKLFACLLGGRAKGCNTELHDMVFVIGCSIEETYGQLVAKWFGDPNKVHIDCYAELKWIDGYELTLTQKKPEDDKSLFFVNYGAYKENLFQEVHEVAFYVATSKSQAVSRAKKELCAGMFQPHLDDNIDISAALKHEVLESYVDDVLEISQVEGHYIHLDKTDTAGKMHIVCGYKKIPLQQRL